MAQRTGNYSGRGKTQSGWKRNWLWSNFDPFSKAVSETKESWVASWLWLAIHNPLWKLRKTLLTLQWELGRIVRFTTELQRYSLKSSMLTSLEATATNKVQYKRNRKLTRPSGTVTATLTTKTRINRIQCATMSIRRGHAIVVPIQTMWIGIQGIHASAS